MPTQPEPRPALRAVLSDQAAEAIAVDAYVYGYPLVLMDVTCQVMTAVSRAHDTRAPINRLAHARTFPTPSFSDIVRPDVDTLSSIAWLNLTREPMVLSVPAMGKRHYMMQLCDAWTNVFAAPGTRTMGNSDRDILIFGPAWRGRFPGGVTPVRSPTALAWLIGRTQTNGRREYPAVHAIQAQYTLVPLGAFGSPHLPPADVSIASTVDRDTPPLEQVAQMDGETFFGRLNTLMYENPPADIDGLAISRFASIGVVPGSPFSLERLPPTTGRVVTQGARIGLDRIVAEAKKPLGRTVNGWTIMPNLGRYGSNYLLRAVVAMVELGASLPEDLICPHATVDADEHPLSGAHRYVIRFPARRLPPVDAFWSLTMYNTRQAFVENPVHRFAIGDRDALAFDADGALTLFLQYDSPGAPRESNWLPTPATAFSVLMRLYRPRKEVLDGSWTPPPIVRLS